MVTNTPLQKSGDSAGEQNFPSGFAYFSHFVVLYLFIVYDIFLVQFGITVLIVMFELLDISIACLLGDLCEMSSIPELECTLGYENGIVSSTCVELFLSKLTCESIHLVEVMLD